MGVEFCGMGVFAGGVVGLLVVLYVVSFGVVVDEYEEF